SDGVLGRQRFSIAPRPHYSNTPLRLRRVVRQLHYVIEPSLRVVASDLQQVHKSFVQTGNRFEVLDSGELAFERAIVLEVGSGDDLHRPMAAQRIARQPDFAVAAPADAADQFVIGNGGWMRVA